jgi:phosphatidylserine/phosphatidylglycerophosphate/cardiolipin synthase-like enzyme
MTMRLIHRTAASSSRDIGECLAGLLLSELLNPGKRMSVVSPWMSDFPVLDNRGGKFAAVDAAWTASWVPFSSVLRALLVRGVVVKIACGEGDREDDLLARLGQGAKLDGSADRLVTFRPPREHLVFSHEKALIADSWAVYGSMNLTYRGVTINGELITVTTDLATVGTVATQLGQFFS